MMMILCQW